MNKAPFITTLMASALFTSTLSFAQESSGFEIPLVNASDAKLSSPPANNFTNVGVPESQSGDQLRSQLNGKSLNVDEYGRPISPQEAMNKSQSVKSNSFLDRVKGKWKPKLALDIEPGDNKVIAVGAGAMNTISTNFKNVSVVSSIVKEDENIIIMLEEGYVYTTINSYDPVTLILREEGVLDSQFTLVLQPVPAPPTRVDINVNMSDEQVASAEQFRVRVEQEAAVLEAQKHSSSNKSNYNYHETRVIDLMAPIANAKLPRGYSLSKDIPPQYRVPCNMAISHGVIERVIGARDIIDIVHIKNDSDRHYQTREEMCFGEDVIAVGVLQKALLAPGEKTVFLIMREKYSANDYSHDLSSAVMLGE